MESALLFFVLPHYAVIIFFILFSLNTSKRRSKFNRIIARVSKASLAKWLLPILGLLLITACNNGNDEAVGPNINGATSQICPNVTGAQAIYWDLSNGIPRGDLPGGIPPTVDRVGGSFSHPDAPTLGFTYPEGYSPQMIRAPQTVGVDLTRQDGQVLWRWLFTPVSGFPSAREIRQAEIQQVLQALGVDPNNIELVCLNEGQANPVANIAVRSSKALVRAGGFTIQAAATVTLVEGLPTSSVNIQMSVGPTAEYDQLIFDTFLAIEWQMLFTDRGTQHPDSDGDGVTDPFDRFPNDPNRN
ncbi:MAG: hypothetical protein AAF632_27180 [Bacteroidota bacterium]